MIFKVPEVPFPGFLSNGRKLEKENICPDYFPDFNLESSIIVIVLLKMFIVKYLTDFRRTVETGVDPRLYINDNEQAGLKEKNSQERIVMKKCPRLLYLLS